MRVQMRQQISGSRGDGTQWPAPGQELDVDDDEGAILVANGSAFPVRTDQETEYREQPGNVVVSATDTQAESIDKGDLRPGADAETMTAQAAERGLYDGTITRSHVTGEYLGDPNAETQLVAEARRRAGRPTAAERRASAEEAGETVGYDSYTKDELAADAQSRGLATSGTKAELVARLEEADRGSEG